MDKRLPDLRQRLQASINHQWCRIYSYELDRLSSSLSNHLPIYRTSLNREQLQTSIKSIIDLEITPTTHELYRRSLANYLLLLSIHTHKLVCTISLEHITDIRRHLHYWKENQFQHGNVIEQIKTTFWFDRDRDDIRTSEKIKFLTNQEELLANTIGHLAYTITHFEQQDQINLDSIMQNTNELYKILFNGSSVDYNAQSDLADVLELYSQMLNSFDDFQNHWKNQIQLYHRPTHFKRYFPYYICGGVITLYAIYRVYSNRTRIADSISSSYESLKFFVNEHLIVPLKTIYASTFESRSSAAAFENSQLNYTHSKKILEEMLEEFGREHADSLAQIEQLNPGEFLQTLNERATNEDMNLVMKYYQQEMNSPIRSALFGDLIKGILIQVQKVKVDGEGLIIQIDQLMRQNEINFSLLATIPVILLLTFLSISTKNIIANRLIKRRTLDFSTLRQQITRKLRQIEQVLIFNSEQPNLMINQQNLIVIEKENHDLQNRKMTTRTFGYFLSFLFELKFYTNQLKSKRMLSEEFNTDINFLTYPQFTVKQKLLLIQQMSHSYAFLVQAGAS